MSCPSPERVQPEAAPGLRPQGRDWVTACPLTDQSWQDLGSPSVVGPWESGAAGPEPGESIRNKSSSLLAIFTGLFPGSPPPILSPAVSAALMKSNR